MHTFVANLIVADTAQNWIFIWNKMPAISYQILDVVLSQVITSGTQRNSVGEASDTTLLSPSDVCSDGNKLIVADAWNHGVLIWSNSPIINGKPAEVVIGKQMMQKNLPNVEGLCTARSALNLYRPYALKVYEIEVIAIKGNRVKLQNNYEVEVERNKLYKLIDDGYIVAPFSDLNELFRFVLR